MREDARAFSRALERSFFSLHPSFEYCEFIEERRGAELGINALSRLPVIDIPPALGTIPFDALNSNASHCWPPMSRASLYPMLPRWSPAGLTICLRPQHQIGEVSCLAPMLRVAQDKASRTSQR